MKKYILVISILFGAIGNFAAQNGYVQPISPPYADVVTDADHPGPRDPVAEKQIRDLIERSRVIGLDRTQERANIEFLDNVLLAPDHIEIKPYGKFVRRALGSPVYDPAVTSRVFDAVNVAVSGKFAFATYRETRTLVEASSNGQSRVFFRVIKVFQKRGDRWQEVSKLSIQNIPVPGPDPWDRRGYWRPKAASIPPPPVVTAADAYHSLGPDRASEEKIKSLLERTFQTLVGHRSPAEVSADIEFDKMFAPDSMRILTSGKFGVRGSNDPTTRNIVFASANAGGQAFATGPRFGANIAVWGDLAVVAHQGPSVDWIYSITFRIFEQHQGRWEQVVNSVWPLYPDPGPDPWAWIY